MRKFKKVIFVAESGNCRAPMAAGILRECIPDSELEIEAKGLVVLFPEPLNPKAEAVMISNGINMENYMSSQLKEEDIDEDTLLLPMEEIQREKILENYANAREENVHVLTDLTGDELEIMNPYGGPLQTYGLCYETLSQSVKKLARLLTEFDEAFGGREEMELV
ncbi:MAG: phosphotyrosine protein phosphatase [Lachnospiraceae bacterium]